MKIPETKEATRINMWIDDQTGEHYKIEDMTREQLIRALNDLSMYNTQVSNHLDRVLDL